MWSAVDPSSRTGRQFQRKEANTLDKTMNLTCFVKQDGAQYSSLCVEFDVASCGDTEDEAMAGLKDAIETYVEYMRDEGLSDKIYRPVPMDELRDFLFTEPNTKEQRLKAVPLDMEYA
jgi:predicted RNase H-like HicB family nuclease